MSVTFTKLFSSITASTIWCESSDTRVVWITMLAMADRHGRVWASIPGLAKEAAVSVDSCRAAVISFMSPDPDSRTKTAEGRRLEEIDGGWRLINHAKYRAIRDEEERRAYKTEKQREYRTSVDNVDTSGPEKTPVAPRSHNAEAEADTDAKKVQRPSRKKSEADPRHVSFKLACESYAKFKGVTFTWGPSEAKQLSLLLAATPTLTLAIFQQCLRNRAGTPSVIHSDRPRMWLPTILSFEKSAKNQFNQPEGVSNGNHGKTSGNINAAQQALAILAERDRAASDPVGRAETGASLTIDAGDLRGGSERLRLG